ncbi:hypothetical protein [Streptomyces oceani]|uniref:hypothetical protein n=1 Tax=Streptomyces oceani TaxID=1075402 RepID=UPI000A527EFC|nr:hypothetical protein [Streptomyces oceani]
MIVRFQPKEKEITLICVLAVLISGCSFVDNSEQNSSGNAESPKPSPLREACGGFFGREGGDILRDLSNGNTAVSVTEKLKKKKRSIVEEMTASADNGDASAKMSKPKLMCSFVAPAEMKWAKRIVELKYGWSSPPRKTERIHTYYSAGSALIDNYQYDSRSPMSVYFKCELPKGDMETALGTFDGKWYGSSLSSSEQGEHLARLLLVTAGKMSEELGCTNNLDLDPETSVERVITDSRKGVKPGLPLPTLPVSGPIES